MSDIQTNQTESLTMASVERVTKKTVAKRVREFEVVESDRIPLVEAANVFVGHVITKQVMPVLASGAIAVELPMSDQETRTYDSALRFLQRQFEQGYSMAEPLEKRIETEQTAEFE